MLPSDTILLVVILPMLALPVTDNTPPVTKLPAVTLPVVEIVFEPKSAKNVATSVFP